MQFDCCLEVCIENLEVVSSRQVIVLHVVKDTFDKEGLNFTSGYERQFNSVPVCGP